MKKTMLIPENLEIGFQERSDVMENRLSYITYRKDDGSIAKELSWTGWKSDEIPVEQHKNVPTSGFIISKDVKEHTWHGNTRVKMRIYDPRGFDFEISINNLFMILEVCDINKCEMIGEFVYAWFGSELILLPTNAEVYKRSKEASDNNNNKIAVKDLKVGAIYRTRIIKGETTDYLYLGRRPWHHSKSYNELEIYNDKVSKKIGLYRGDNQNDDYSQTKNAHVFYDFKYKNYCINITNKLAICVEEDSEDFHELDNAFEKTLNASKIVDFKFHDNFNASEFSFFFYPLNNSRYLVVEIENDGNGYRKKGIANIWFMYKDAESNLFYKERAFLDFESRQPYFRTSSDNEKYQKSLNVLIEIYNKDKDNFIKAVKDYDFNYFRKIDSDDLKIIKNEWLGLIILLDGNVSLLKNIYIGGVYGYNVLSFSNTDDEVENIEVDAFFKDNIIPELRPAFWVLENDEEIDCSFDFY